MRRLITVAALVAAFFVPTVASAQAPNQGGWQQIQGTVHTVSGSTFTLTTDDGRRLSVNMSKVGTEIQQNVHNGDRVTVAAYQVSGNNVRAEFIQKNSSASAAPSASPPNTAADQSN